MTISDMAEFQAILQSSAGAEAIKHDGVRPDTLVMLIES